MPTLSNTEDDRVTDLADRATAAVNGSRSSARAQFRPTPDQKELFMRAASLQGQTLSEFMRVAVEERAKSVIAEHERIVLNAQARDTFLSALANPPKPNDKLAALAARYAREVTSRQ